MQRIRCLCRLHPHAAPAESQPGYPLVDRSSVRRHLGELPEVVSIHDLHAWTLASKLPVLTAHVVVADSCLRDGSSGMLLELLQQCLADHFDVEHSTFQLEGAGHAAHEGPTHS